MLEELDNNPHNGAASRILSLVYSSLGDKQSAIYYLEHTIEVSSVEDTAGIMKHMMDYTRLCMEAEELDRGIVGLNNVIERYPDKPELYSMRGALYEGKHEWQKAENEYMTVLKLNPNYYLGYYCMGHMLEMQEEYDKALEYYTRALEKTISVFNFA
jgi:tetratricopeptide (TPR) repeat protein